MISMEDDDDDVLIQLLMKEHNEVMI